MLISEYAAIRVLSMLSNVRNSTVLTTRDSFAAVQPALNANFIEPPDTSCWTPVKSLSCPLLTESPVLTRVKTRENHYSFTCSVVGTMLFQQL